MKRFGLLAISVVMVLASGLTFRTRADGEKVFDALHFRSPGSRHVHESSRVPTGHPAGAGSLDECLRDDF